MRNIIIVTQGKIASGAEKVTSILYEDRKKETIVVSGTKPQLDYFSNCGFVVEKVRGLQPLNRESLKLSTIVRVVKSFSSLRKVIKKYQPEYIHVYNIPSLLYTSICNIGFKIPIILHVHDYYSKDKLIKLFCFFLKKKAKVVIAVSKSIKRDLIKLKFPEERIKVIHNGIVNVNSNGNEEKMLTYKKNNNNINLLFIGSISRWKGLHVLIKALKILEIKKDINLKIFIAGPFLDKEYENEIKQLTKELRYETAFLGKVQNVDELMKNMDILVHCSIEKDPFPTVVLEGLAAGLSVIASSAGGAKEVIIEMKTGLLHARGNYQELASKLLLLINNPNLRKELSSNAIKYANENLSKEKYKKMFFREIEGLNR